MRPGLEVGAQHVEVERLDSLTGPAPSLPADGLWALALAVEHAARRWMTEFVEVGEQSVGAKVDAERLAPVAPGVTLHSTATLSEIRGRRYLFSVEVRDDGGALVARGVNERAVIALPAQ